MKKLIIAHMAGEKLVGHYTEEKVEKIERAISENQDEDIEVRVGDSYVGIEVSSIEMKVVDVTDAEIEKFEFDEGIYPLDEISEWV